MQARDLNVGAVSDGSPTDDVYDAADAGGHVDADMPRTSPAGPGLCTPWALSLDELLPPEADLRADDAVHQAGFTCEDHKCQGKGPAVTLCLDVLVQSSSGSSCSGMHGSAKWCSDENWNQMLTACDDVSGRAAFRAPPDAMNSVTLCKGEGYTWIQQPFAPPQLSKTYSDIPKLHDMALAAIISTPAGEFQCGSD
eukprot:7797673-Karenia_brevis.AAC.1